MVAAGDVAAHQGGGEVGPQDLDRHLAVVLEVLGQVDSGHPAATKLLLDSVPVCEGCFEALEDVRHSVLAPLATQ